MKGYVYWWMIIILIVRDFLLTFLRSFALLIGKPIITTSLAKWKTFLQMTFVFLILIYINISGLPDIRLKQAENPWLLWTTIILSLVVCLTIYSGLHYLIVNRNHLNELYRRIIHFSGKKFSGTEAK
jgi:CDP-diacylglycerol--glycerol-3-phosphate 3-phosphatidyltransferase